MKRERYASEDSSKRHHYHPEDVILFYPSPAPRTYGQRVCQQQPSQGSNNPDLRAAPVSTERSGVAEAIYDPARIHNQECADTLGTRVRED